MGAMSVVCTAGVYTGAVFFHVFLKFKRGMPAVSSMTMLLCVYMLRIYGAAFLLPAISH